MVTADAMTERLIPLSTKLGEVMAPQTLVTVLLLRPDGRVTVEPGALHGRSELESQLTMVPKREEVGGGQPHWFVWVAVELDAANQPVRYKGLSVGEWFVNPDKRLGYKSLAEQVNRMGEAMRGGVNLAKLPPQHRPLVKQQLAAISSELWERATDAVKQSLES